MSVCSKCKSGQREGPSIEELEHLLHEEKQRNTRLLKELATAKSLLYEEKQKYTNSIRQH